MTDTLRWGIIGAGNVAETKSGPALAQVSGSTLVAVMRRDEAKVKEFAARHKVPKWYTTVEALLADPQVNAVYIASPHHEHLAHVRLAAATHQVLLCEKPAGINLTQAQQINDVCAQNGTYLTIAYYRRFWAVTQKLRALLQEGAIGEVVQAQIQLCDYFSADPSRPWLTTRAYAGGGALANAGSHWVDLIRYLFGEVTEVIAFSQSPRYEIEDTIAAQLRLQSGAVVALNVNLNSVPTTNSLEVYGTRGRLSSTSLSEGHLTLFRPQTDPEVMHFPRHTVNHTELIAALIAARQANQPPPVTGADAVATWRIMAAVYQAAAEKVCITL